MTSNANFTTSKRNAPPLGQSSTSKQFSSRDEAPLLTLKDLRNLDFNLFNESTRFSWSPMAAFYERDTGGVGPTGDFATLHDYLTKPEYIDIAAETLLEVSQRLAPTSDVLMSVYRAADKDCGMDYGVILPGASVTESKSHAKRHAALYLNDQHILMTTKVYPDELVTHGDPHEFIYVPRSLMVGYERYTTDLARTKANA